MNNKTVDLSVVLNAHNENTLIPSAIRSICESILYFNNTGKTARIIAVLDNPSMGIEDIIKCTLDEYPQIENTVECVDLRSLGAARNVGIGLSNSRFISTADADDLVSFNYFSRMYDVVTNNDGTIAVPNYYVGFGKRNRHVYHLDDFCDIDQRILFNIHPYVSRIMFPISLSARVQFIDNKESLPVAFEDWCFNADVIAEGFDIKVAKNTVVFYRQRPDSMLRRANKRGITVAYSDLFKPENFLKLRTREPITEDTATIRQSLVDEFYNNRVVLESFRDANEIDPQVSLSELNGVDFLSAQLHDTDPGAAYQEFCNQVQSFDDFTDIWIHPFLAPGGAEKYISDVLDSLSREGICKKALIVLVQEHKSSQTSHLEFGESVVVVDLFELTEGLPFQRQVIDRILLYVLEGCRELQRIHVAGGPWMQRVFSAHKERLRNLPFVYYRFGDVHRLWRDQLESIGNGFGDRVEYAELFDTVISDHQSVLSEDTWRMGGEAGHSRCIYAKTASVDLPKSHVRPGGHRINLLWASRLDAQKRPDLIAEIARTANHLGMNVNISVYGIPVLDEFDVSVWDHLPNVSYRGRFSGISREMCRDVSAFLYTSAFDGLPNTLIESMSLGLPVIAPDLAGIQELVDHKVNGFLVDHQLRRQELIEAYLRVVGEIQDMTDSEFEAMSINAKERVLRQHSAARHQKRVRRVFGS